MGFALYLIRKGAKMAIIAVSQAEMVAAKEAGKMHHCARCGGSMLTSKSGGFSLHGYPLHQKCAGEIVKVHGDLGKITGDKAMGFFLSVKARYIAEQTRKIRTAQQNARESAAQKKPDISALGL